MHHLLDIVQLSEMGMESQRTEEVDPWSAGDLVSSHVVVGDPA